MSEISAIEEMHNLPLNVLQGWWSKAKAGKRYCVDYMHGAALASPNSVLDEMLMLRDVAHILCEEEIESKGGQE